MKNILRDQLKTINSHFTDEDLELGLSYFEFKEFKANDMVSRPGEICNQLILSEKSITRNFYIDKEGKEQTIWMKPEMTFLTDFKSFVNQEKSFTFIQFYEDTTVAMISRENLVKLYESNKNWALFGVHLTEKLHVTLIDVFVNLLANDATRNYQYIEYAFPRFIQVAPLKDIASMLQVSPVTLSRIRAGKQLK